MAALSSVDYASGVLAVTTTGTVFTLNAVAAVAGTPAAQAMTVQNSSLPFAVTVSSLTGGTITSLASGTVNITGGTITSLTSGTVVISSGTLNLVNTVTTVGSVSSGNIATVGTVASISSGTLASLSSGVVAIGNAGTVTAVKAANTAASSTDPAFVVAISPNNSITAAAATSAISTVITSAGNNATNIKTTSATFLGGHFYNNGSSTVYVKIYNSSIAPTVGSTTMIMTIGISPGAARDVVLAGVTSSLGLGYTTTLGVTSTSTSAVGADDITGAIEYR